MINMKFWIAAALSMAVLSGCGGNDGEQQNTVEEAAVMEGEGLDAGAAKELASAAKSAGPASNAADSSTLPPQGEIAEAGTFDPSAEDGEDSLLAVPNPAAPNAIGFGRKVTGGGSASNVERIRVGTKEALARELCRTQQGGACTDTTPRIIEVASTIDFTNSMGQGHARGCVYSTCKSTNGNNPERLVVLEPKDAAHCNGKTSINDISYDKAGTEPLLIGSNKTLIGVGAAGVIKGKGLMLRNGVSNIIIRNLTFSDINPGIVFAGDAIRLGNTDGVWIDHNRFVRIARQMIVSGWQGGAASNVTISWNDFDGRSAYPLHCDGKHYWNLLLTGKNDTITFASNWMRSFSGRSPAVHGTDSVVHLVNNYFDEGSGTALDATASNRVLLEGNYFKNVHSPITVDSKNRGNVFALHGKPSAAEENFCRSKLQRACVSNATPGSGVANFTSDASVLDGVRGVSGSPYSTKTVPILVPQQAGPGHLGR